MILVDTSVWIELLRGRQTPAVSPDDLLAFVTCGPIVQEVLQGLREGPLSDACKGGERDTRSARPWTA